MSRQFNCSNHHEGKCVTGWWAHEAGILLQVLQADSNNVKALFRRAQAHLAQQDFVEAELDIKAALLVCASPSADHGSSPQTVRE